MACWVKLLVAQLMAIHQEFAFQHLVGGDIFGKYGAIRQIRIGTNEDTRATAFVVYKDIYDAKNAVDHLSGFNFSIATWLCCIINMLRCQGSSISARRRRNSPSFRKSMRFQQRRSRNSICKSRTATATMERRWSFTTVLVLLGVLVAWISEKLFYNQETNCRVLSLRVLDSISSKVTEKPLLSLLRIVGLYNFLRLLQVSGFLVQDCVFPPSTYWAEAQKWFLDLCEYSARVKS